MSDLGKHVFAGELKLVSAQLSAVEWETAFRSFASDPALHTLRALNLDDNDLGGAPASALASAVGRLERLVDLSVCDAHLSGTAVTQLLSALAAVPAFSKSHAEVWAPADTMPYPPQGARLCLMRNGISNDELSGPCLRGLHELCLSGNVLITDGGLAPLAALAPSLRVLHLGRTGIIGSGMLGILDKHWPMLECLALNHTEMTTQSFEKGLCNALHKRAREIEKRALVPCTANGEGLPPVPPDEKAVDDKPHRYFHLDLRGIRALSPPKLHELAEKMHAYQKECDQMMWIKRQHFGGGRHHSHGLVLRHDYEGEMTLRLKIELEPLAEKEKALPGRPGGSSSAPAGPYFLEVSDVKQKMSVAEIVSGLLQACNEKAGNSAVEAKAGKSADGDAEADKAVKAQISAIRQYVSAVFALSSFPVCVEGKDGREWRAVAVQAPGGRELLQPERARDNPLHCIAVGSLLHDQRAAEGGFAFNNQEVVRLKVEYKKDKEGKTVYKKDKDGNMVSDSKNILIKVGKPTLSAERWLAELSLKLALKPKADKEKDKEAAAAGAKRKLES